MRFFKRLLPMVVAFGIVAAPAPAHLPKNHSPASFIEHGSAVLVWLVHHPKAGTPTSRHTVHQDHHWLVIEGLKRAGVYYNLLCLHRFEASWYGDNNPVYDGGLQMDSQFQGTYGREFVQLWGQASHWPVWAQLVAAWRATISRGYNPWPTRRYCGL